MAKALCQLLAAASLSSDLKASSKVSDKFCVLAWQRKVWANDATEPGQNRKNEDHPGFLPQISRLSATTSLKTNTPGKIV